MRLQTESSTNEGEKEGGERRRRRRRTRPVQKRKAHDRNARTKSMSEKKTCIHWESHVILSDVDYILRTLIHFICAERSDPAITL